MITQFFKTHRRIIRNAIVILGISGFLVYDYRFDLVLAPLLQSDTGGEPPDLFEPPQVVMWLQIGSLAVCVFSRYLPVQITAGAIGAFTILIFPQSTVTCAIFLPLFYLLRYDLFRRRTPPPPIRSEP